MCGILATYGLKINNAEFARSLAKIKHRGPDETGVFFDEKELLYLGQQRLSIIDLSVAGRQPMFSADKKLAIIFNGEIYNYIELKKELEVDYSFQNKTDTEVILAAYQKWGEQSVNKLEGMFAYVIFDFEQKRIFGARDRFGIKPFFYFLGGDYICLSSEIKALLSLLPGKAEPNKKMIFDYLNFGYYDHTEETFFNDIKRIPAAHYFYFSPENGLQLTKYWDLADQEWSFEHLSLEKTAEKLQELMSRSIKMHFRSDVPVGINLSSGLDSNTLRYFSRKHIDFQPHLFSVGMKDQEHDECQFILPLLSAEEKDYWHDSYLEPVNLITRIEKMVEYQDEPFGGLPTIAYEGVYTESKKTNVKVLLEGQGMDEILAGYQYYLIDYLRDIVESRPDLSVAEILSDNSYFSDSISPELKERLAAQIDSSESIIGQDLTRNNDSSILSSDFAKRYAHRSSELCFARPFSSHLQNAQYRDIMYTKLPRVLRFNDCVSMAYGTELRVPFLDHNLVEFCFFQPAQHKINRGIQKYLLRKSMDKIVAHAVINNNKISFGAVQSKWLKQYLADFLLEIIDSDSFKGREFWDSGKVRNSVLSLLDGKVENSFPVWQLINLELWLRKYFDK